MFSVLQRDSNPWSYVGCEWVFIAQLVEHCSANAEAMGSNPVEAPKTFFGLNCDCKHNCDDHTFISETQLFTFLMLSIAVHIFAIIKIFAVDDNLTNTKLRVHTSIPINFFAIYVNSTIAKCCASVELMNHFLRN